MADWQNIPRLDPALQDEIDNVQLKHNALVKAVRSYPGGSIAGKTNEVMGTHQDNLDTVATREKTLLSAIGQPEPAPSMLLDFASQTYFTGVRGLEQAVDPHKYLNVSRATPKWVMGPRGKLVEVPPDTLAYEYDPVTGEAKGVLIEESRTNLLQWSEDYTNAWWSQSNGSIEASDVLSPDGVSNASKFVGDSGDSWKRLFRFIPFAQGTTYTKTWFVKKGEARYCSTYFRASEFARASVTNTLVVDLETGDYRNGNGVVPYVERLPDGWFRIGITAECTTSQSSQVVLSITDSLDLKHNPSITGDGTSGIYVWGAQFEEGPTPSSYIPTEDAPVTRAADNVSRELGDEFNPSEGTIYVKWFHDFPNDSLIRSVMKIRNNTQNQWNSLGVEYPGGTPTRLRLGVRSNSYGVFQRLVTGDAAKGVNAAAIAYKADGTFAITLNGQLLESTSLTEVEGFSAFLRELNEIMVGDGFRLGGGAVEEGRRSNQPLLDISAFPRALTETELEELTANG